MDEHGATPPLSQIQGAFFEGALKTQHHLVEDFRFFKNFLLMSCLAAESVSIQKEAFAWISYLGLP